MAKLTLKKAETDVITTVFIQDSSSTTGAGLDGLAYDTSGLKCYYVRPGSAAAQLTLATQTVTGSHSDGGFVEIDSTNMPGWYRLDLSDAICATGVDFVGVHLMGATNMGPCPLEIQLTDIDLNTATISADVVSISGDSGAADNLELDYDGTGYTKTNSTVGTVTLVTTTTDVTNQVTADVTAISGDSTAADNLESACDGGSYNVGGGGVVAASVTGACGSVTGAVGSVTGNVGGNVTGSVGSVVGAVGSVTAEVSADVTKISGDATAADNLELDYDGTGYNKANSTIGTVTAVTDDVTPDSTTVQTYCEAAINALFDFNSGGRAMVDVTHWNTVSVAGNLMTLSLKTLDIQNSTGGGTGYGVHIKGGADAPALYVRSTTSGNAVQLEGAGANAGFYTKGGTTGPGMFLSGGATSGAAFGLSTTNGHGISMALGTGTNLAMYWDGGETTGDIDEMYTSIDAILTDTNQIQGKLPTGDMVDSGAVTSACTSSLNTYDPPTKTEMDSGFSGLNDISTGEVLTQCNASITGFNLDQLTGAAVTGFFSGSLYDELTEDDGPLRRFTTNALENGPGGGSSSDVGIGMSPGRV